MTVQELATSISAIAADYLATKERALAKLTSPEGSIPRFKPADSVLAFLDSL
jgi:hypothetical protein